MNTRNTLFPALVLALAIPTLANGGKSVTYREDTDRKSWELFTGFLKERLQ